MDKVVVIGKDYSGDTIEEEWLVFSRDILHNGTRIGKVEIAFALHSNADKKTSIQPIADSPIVVFFPTVLPTYLGFLIQGPYRTTPSRDNIPENDLWNRRLVEETAQLLVEALHRLRDYGLLNVSALRCLPLDPSRFGVSSRFGPLFSSVRDALMSEPLLPRYQGGHIAAFEAKIAGSQEIRNLFTPEQLTELFESQHQVAWLSEEITADRTPELRKYLIEELDVEEILPDDFLSMLTKDFLEAQSDEWIERLYVFFQGQQALLRRSRRRMEEIPLVRIESGVQVVPFINGRPQAYLPSSLHTDFPTVPPLCVSSEDAWGFLVALGLNVPDPVDDIIANIIPKYRKEKVDVPEAEYNMDIEQMLVALETDSRERRQRLIDELKSAKMLLAVDSTGTREFVLPSQAYQATQRLKDLLNNIPKIWIVDDSKEYLRRGATRGFLNALGAPEYLALELIDTTLDGERKLELRKSTGDSEVTYDIRVEDYTLKNLNSLLDTMTELPFPEASVKAGLLWEALCDFQANHGAGAFDAHYHWFRYSLRKARFDASFIQMLNNTPWVPSSDGHLSLPGAVTFEETNWKENHTLTSLIAFKPRVMDELAKEAGFEPGALDFLKKLGLTSLADLEERLGTGEDTNVDDPPVEQREDGRGDSSGESDSDIEDTASSESAQTGTKSDEPQTQNTKERSDISEGSNASPNYRNTNDPSRPREFVSYVRVRSDDGEEDPDGLVHEARMTLEDTAISLIQSEEPQLKRTPTNNPGFDLSEVGPDGKISKWVEVKAMTGTLDDRPVGLSKTQFEYAQEHRSAYWLYVVERAGDSEEARVLRIQDPAGKAQTFTFDHGWRASAVVQDADD